ncbi:MAG: leucine-rich repeat protein [Clostridia bacterium]|nr:leucine-rich repeat protein [Clostridia bacterium]
MENRRSKKALLIVLAALCVILALTLVACNTTTIQKIKFKVTFDVDGVSYYEINTQGTEVLQMPENPTKDGYIFDGWYWDKDAWTRPFTANSLLNEPLKEDMRIYAKWKSESDEDDEKEPQIQGTELSAKTLTVDGKNLYAKLPNATDTFSFVDEISVADGATYAVHTDMSCSGASELRSKIATLKSGDNVFYILVTNGDNTELYTATIRRRPIYSVTFDTNGGDSVQTQYIEEDDIAEELATTRRGYTFDSWDYDFSKPIVRSTTITASWIADKYKITYVMNGGTDCNNVAEYTIEDGVINLNDGIGENLFCGWYLDDTFENYVESIDCNELKNYTLYALFDGTNGLKISQEEVIGYSGDSNDVVIPSKYKGYNVTSISSAFQRRARLTNVTIPNSVTNIGSYAFEECSGLTGVTIPNSVTSIGDAAFLGCSGLTRVIIPDSVKSIGNGAFQNCSGLTSVIIPNGVTTIEGGAFSLCNKLISIVIPDSVTSVGDYAFAACRVLKSVTLSDKMTSIGECMFYGCSELTSITIPDSVTSIGEDAFEGCRGLISVTIGKGVTSIGHSAFKGCSELMTVNWNATACTIADDSAFYGINHPIFDGCTSLLKLNIGNNVTAVPNYAFYGCNALTHVIIGNSVESIGKYVFYGCSGLMSVTIPDSATSIGEYAFYGCSELTSVTIGNGVKHIGSSAFNRCTALNAVYINDIAKWCEISFSSTFANPLYYAHILYLNGELLTDLVVPNSVKSIGAYAFIKCNGLTSLTIDNGIVSIGEYAFEDCSGLNSATIPNSVTSMDKYAFSGCRVSAVYIQDIATWCEISFGNVHANPLYYAKYLYLNGELVTDLVIPDSVTRISDYAFGFCKGLKSVTIGNNVTHIGYWAFYGCDGVTSVIISNSVTRIGECAFDIYNSRMCVYYNGTATDWAKISIDSNHDKLADTPRYYYSEEEPPTNDEGTDYDGNYWHYVNGVVTVWVKEN